MYKSLAAGLSVALLAGAASAQTTLRLGHVFETSHPLSQELQNTADRISERTEGEVTIDLFPASQLGTQPELIEALSLGTVDMTIPGSAFLGNTEPRIAVTSAPYAYCDLDHFVAYSNSDQFEELSQVYTDTTDNHILGMWYYGKRHLTANAAVEAPSDAEGLKIRVPNATIYSMFPDLIGANPTPIAFAETYLALQQGVVDGQENPLPVIMSKKFYEVQSHVNLTGHMVDNVMPIISGFAWDNLSEEHQQIVSDEFTAAAERTVSLISENEAEMAEEMRDMGVNVVDVDQDAFSSVVRPELTGDDVAWTNADYQAIQDTAPDGSC